MITKEIIKEYHVRRCAKYAYIMSNEKGLLKLLEKMILNGISGQDIIEDEESEDYNEDEFAENKVSKIDSFYELIRSNKNLYMQAKKQVAAICKEDQVATFIESMKNHQEVAQLSRLWAIEKYIDSGKVVRADTIDGSIDGHEIHDGKVIEANTQKYLQDTQVRVILEGQITYQDCLARWDILVKTEQGYELYECKGTTNIYGSRDEVSKLPLVGSLKSPYIYDIAFQDYVYQHAGLPIRSLNYLILNKQFMLPLKDMTYPIDKEFLTSLFVIYNTAKIGKKDKVQIVPLLEYIHKGQYYSHQFDRQQVEYYINRVREALKLEQQPAGIMTYACKSAGGCLMKTECNPGIDANHIFTLTCASKCGGEWHRVKKLIEEGVTQISKIPETYLNHGIKQAKDSRYAKYWFSKEDGVIKKSNAYMQIQAARGQKDGFNFIEAKCINQLLKKDYSVFPLIFFDFETFSYPIPLVAESFPWEQVCSQYSMHVVRPNYDLAKHNFELGTGGGIAHYEFIGRPYIDGFKKPERDLLKTLQDQFKQENIDWTTGQFTLIVYNESFEKGRFKDMAQKYPEFHDFCLMCRARVVDLLKFFSFGYWYRGDFNGRTSLKVTQPSALTDPSILSWYQALPYSLSATLNYKTGKIHNGEVALDVYQTLLRAKAANMITKQEHDEYITALLHYCKIDSWGTVILYDIIKKLNDKLLAGDIELSIDYKNLL